MFPNLSSMSNIRNQTYYPPKSPVPIGRRWQHWKQLRTSLLRFHPLRDVLPCEHALSTIIYSTDNILRASRFARRARHACMQAAHIAERFSKTVCASLLMLLLLQQHCLRWFGQNLLRFTPRSPARAEVNESEMMRRALALLLCSHAPFLCVVVRGPFEGFAMKPGLFSLSIELTRVRTRKAFRCASWQRALIKHCMRMHAVVA